MYSMAYNNIHVYLVLLKYVYRTQHDDNKEIWRQRILNNTKNLCVLNQAHTLAGQLLTVQYA